MALEEDQKKLIISQINNKNFDVAAEMITGIQGEDDHNEALSEFLENMSQNGEAYISDKMNLVVNIVHQNLQQKPNVLEDSLYGALRDVKASAGNMAANQQGPVDSEEDLSSMNIDEVENMLNSLKSQQALLIRTNKPLDPEISKKIKLYQAARDKLYQVSANSTESNKPEKTGGWFNFASNSEISGTLDYEICQGTAVTAAIKSRMDKDVERGRIVLSTQDSIKSSQIKEFMQDYIADMPEITDGDEFVKEASKIFDNNKKLQGKILENSKGIDHGGIFPIGSGWLVIIRRKQSDSSVSQHQFFTFDIDSSAYFTIRFHRRFKGGKIYPDAYTMIEMKGDDCISLVQSSKGENVIDPAQLQRIKTQVSNYDKTFDKDLIDAVEPSLLKIQPKMSEEEVLAKVKKEKLEIEEEDTPQESGPIEVSEPAPLPSSPANDTAAADPQDVVANATAAPQAAKQAAVANAAPAVQEVAQAASSDNHEENVEKKVNPEVQQKIDNLQALLQQAKINNQTSTITRLEEDIEELEAQKYDMGPAAAEISNSEMPPEEEVNFDPDHIASMIDKMPFEQNIKDMMHQAVQHEFDYDHLDVKKATELVKKFFAHMHYEDLLKLRNKLTNNAKYLEFLPYYDAYLTDYIELAYIAGDYQNKANKILDESDKKSKEIAKEQDEITRELEKLEKGEPSASDLNKKINLQNRSDELHQMGDQITLDIEKAKIYLDADIEQIERIDYDAEHNQSRKKLNPNSDAEKDKLIEKYKDKLQKVSDKLPTLDGEEFTLADGDFISDEQIDKLDVSKISAKSLADLAIALGEPVDLADEKKAKSVLDTVNIVKNFDKYIGEFFRKVDKHKKKIKYIKKALEKTQSQIIEHERELESIKIANKVKLTPMIEEKKLLEEKIANLESNQ